MDHPVFPRAERFSFYSHALGFLAALVGAIFLQLRAEGGWDHATLAIYSLTTMVLFSASTLHHVHQSGGAEGRSGWQRRFDHISIYLFIAGTYTAVVSLGIPTTLGFIVLGGVWLFAIVGIILKITAAFFPRWVTAGLYIAMGWMALIAIPSIVRAFDSMELILLTAGGVVYTLGAVGYAMKKPDLWPESIGFHGIWHVMVLIAAVCHYALVYQLA